MKSCPLLLHKKYSLDSFFCLESNSLICQDGDHLSWQPSKLFESYLHLIYQNYIHTANKIKAYNIHVVYHLKQKDFTGLRHTVNTYGCIQTAKITRDRLAISKPKVFCLENQKHHTYL